MDRKARYSVLFCPSITSGADCGRPSALMSPAGHTHRADLEFPPGVIPVDAAS